MSSATNSIKMALRRTEYLVDRPMQLGAAISVASLLGLIGVFCAAVLYLGPSEELLAHLSPQEIKAVFTYSIAAFFAMGVVVVMTCAIVFTHRVAGSSRVLVAAIEGMLEGDFEKRVTLRKKDYLHKLSEAIGNMQQELSKEPESDS